MNKAFTKDDDAREPVLVTARAPLPEGTPNYVTPRGLAQLEQERTQLTAAKEYAEEIADDAERRRQLGALQARLTELELRLVSAELVVPSAAPPDQARFGARVRVRGEDGAERVYRIVGVDEADAAQGFIAFTAPLSRALMGRRPGDVIELRTPRGEEELEVIAVDYEERGTG